MQWKMLLFLGSLLAIFSMPAFAQEVSDLEKRDGKSLEARRPRQTPWDASLAATWLPASDLRGSSAEVEMTEVKAALSRRFGITSRLQLSSGFSYTLRNIDAPETARLPDSLHSISLNLAGEYRYSDPLTLVVRIAPGLSGDLRDVGGDDVRVPVAVQARYRAGSSLTAVAGVAYTGQSHSIPLLPILGVTYLPSQRWSFILGFPRTAAVYTAREGTEIYLAGEFSGGEYGLHDRRLGAEVVRYRDYRGLLGVEFPLLPELKLALSGGYAFAREFSFYEGDRGDLKLNNAPFARLEVKFQR